MPRQAPQAGQVLRAVRNCRLGWALQAECCVIAECTALTDPCRACCSWRAASGPERGCKGLSFVSESGRALEATAGQAVTTGCACAE